MENMRSSGDSTVGVILVAPGSVLRSLVTLMLAPKGGETAEPDQTSATEDESDLPQIVVEPLSLDTLEQLTHLIEGTSTVPLLLFCEEDTFRALSGREGLTVEELSGTQVVGQELLNAFLSAVVSGQRPAASGEIPINIGLGGLLSTRELEVLELLAQGASNKQISDALSIAPNTVYTHVRHIKSKLRTANRTQTALLARTLLGQSEP